MVVIKKSKKKIVKKVLPKNKTKIKTTKTKVLGIFKRIIKPKNKIASSAIRRRGGKKIIKKEASESVKVKKYSNNPIIEPTNYSWESQATFNPTAFEHEGEVHIVYRAVGEDNSSVLGYACTQDGFNIEDRLTHHIYKRFFNYNENGPKIDYLSGGGWSGGCEDPRVVLIDGVVYMIFTAFDGWGSVRLALTSINFEDFKNKRWNWKKAVMISPSGEINKNWVMFPEKINGKFAILHSFYPKILIDYFDDLDELDGSKFIKSNNTRPVDYTRGWDSWFRGVGPAPIKTKDGWLLLYHAMDYKNADRYKIGALLLDLNDPTKILHRSSSPILEPEEDYENNGHKWGVVYCCGAVVKNDELIVYYGGADKFVCAASINLEELISDLKQDKEVKLKKNNKGIK